MELNNKEQKFKDILADVDFDLDTEEMWSAVSNDLEKKKKRRFFIWLFPLLICCFTLGGVISYNVLNSKTKTPLSNNTNFNQEEKNQIVTKEKLSSTSLEKEKSQEALLTIEGNAQSLSKSELVQNKLTGKKVINNYLDQNIINNSSINSSFGRKPNKQNNILSNKIILEQLPFKTIEEVTEKNYNEATDKNTNTIVSNNIYNLSNRNISLKNQQKRSTILTLNIAEPEVIIHKKRKNTLFITLHSGVLKNNFKHDIGQINSEFDSRILEKDSGVYANATDLSLGIETKKHWRFFTGISYANAVSRFYDDSVISSTKEIQGITTIYNGVETSGQITETTINYNDIQWYRQQKQLDIHFGVSKSLLSLGNIQVVPETVVAYNINSVNSGYYYEEENQTITKFKTGESNPYKNNVGLKVQFGLGIEYSLKSVNIGLKGIYRNTISHITTQNYFLPIKNSQYGLQLSVAYRPTWEKV